MNYQSNIVIIQTTGIKNIVSNVIDINPTPIHSYRNSRFVHSVFINVFTSIQQSMYVLIIVFKASFPF